ncbi:LEAF RUST 10 DISEASE-RESISTANCE LOCUS RECEPTOR-LIKE PROTEIN KINASE-like 2.7 isoform X3 [Silene latifolia]|uniref:LEAF RUST 10 DISEASE-RESISTANCE LOCUS RECEPTOR-LIKE PROTEIN KINASE-like 2.7 isoform X3 n=1 Tax=Silene latifolia TaxID=37657 RepID=UPI003D7767AF
MVYSFFSMLFIFPLIFHNNFVKADSDEYEECKKPFQCPNSNFNLSYPFYDGDNRPSYCGYPGFQIDCGDSHPEISMSSDTYYLLNMSSTSDTVTVVSKDYYTVNGVCPQNLNINSTLYKYASTNVNVTIFYGCPSTTAAIATSLPCRNTSNSNNQLGYYATQSAQAKTLNATCQTSVVLPTIPQSSSNQNTSSGSLQGISQGGFGLEWMAENEFCDGCRGSGGLCGSDAALGIFTCYCPNGSYESDCNGSTSQSSHKLHTILGVILGILFSIWARHACSSGLLYQKAIL